MHFKLKCQKAGLGNRFLNVFGSLIELNTLYSDFTFDVSCRILRKMSHCSDEHSSLGLKTIYGKALGEVVYDTREIDVGKYFVKITHEQPNQTLGIHFRGRDFALWDPDSIIPSSYFIEGIEDRMPENIYLCSDDLSHPNIKGVLEWLRDKEINLRLGAGNMLQDLYMLASCHSIIASPSTFSLTSAIIGGKNIVYPARFAQKKADLDSQFWGKAVEGENSLYVSLELR